MKSDAVIEDFNVVEDSSASLGDRGEAVMIDQFVFEAAKEALDKGIVVAVSLRLIEAVRRYWLSSWR